MADLLIRDLAPGTKTKVEKRAKAAGHSLSEEAKRLISIGLASEENMAVPGRSESPADAMRAAFAGSLMTDAEHAEFTRILEVSRKSPPRPLPELE